MQVNIERVDCRDGWCVFAPGKPAPKNDDLPFLLNDTLQGWLIQNPHITVRAVLPIVSKGNTVGIHVWFD